jgi:stage V sporulation protein G
LTKWRGCVKVRDKVAYIYRSEAEVSGCYLKTRGSRECRGDRKAGSFFNGVGAGFAILKKRRAVMQITDIRVRKVFGEGKLKAYITVTFDDCFVVHNVKVIEGSSGVFIAMPSRKTKSGEYKDIAHPIQHDFRNELQEKILEKYESGEDDQTLDV